MSVPNNKPELERAIQSALDKILSDYSGIPVEFTRKIGIEGNVKNTEISVSDTLAYLIGWGKLVLKWYKLKECGKPVDFPETDYKWNELGRLAQSFHHEYKDWQYNDLLKEFEKTTADILKLISSLDNHQLYGISWYKKYTLGKMIQFNTSSPMRNMRRKVRKFKKENGLT